MAVLQCSCVRHVGGNLRCCKCDVYMVKNGFDSKGTQRYFCKTCKKSQVAFYRYKAYNKNVNENIIALTKEGVGILGTARLLGISATTLLKRIKSIAAAIVPPAISFNQTYEVDEMRTFIKHKDKLIWIVYALEKESKKVVSFAVGARTNKTLNIVVKTVLLSNPTRIYTDKLINYKTLISKEIHNFKNRATNHIERNNLTLRTHLKRLNRRSISFSKSAFMLFSVLKIYFWA